MNPGWQSAAERRNRKTWPHPVGNVDPFPSPLTAAEVRRVESVWWPRTWKAFLIFAAMMLAACYVRLAIASGWGWYLWCALMVALAIR